MTKKSLAEKVGVTPRTVTGWEAGEYPPEGQHPQAIVRVLDFPVSFFSLDDSAKVGAGAVSFRSLSTKKAAQRDAVFAMCDIATDLSAWIETRFDLPANQLPDLRGEEPTEVARLVRHEWGLGTKPIKSMLHLLEAKGVRVFALPDNCREVDACSFWSGSTPFVLLNTKVSNERMRFDMAHELLHLIAHRHEPPLGPVAEKEANTFAREFLMPPASVQANRARVWTIDVLIAKKKIWNVSASALAYQLNSMGFLSEWSFKSINIELQRRGYKASEPDGTPLEQSAIFDAVLGRLREIGMPLRHVANQLCLPVDEVRGLFLDLARVSFDGEGHASDDERQKAALRVIK